MSNRAQEIVDGDRTEKYGHPFDSFSRIAQMWSAILGVPVTPEDVGHCMIAFKVIRDSYNPSQENRDDIEGYSYCLEKIEGRREEMRQYQKWINGLPPIPAEPATTTYDSAEPELAESTQPKLEQAAEGLIDLALGIYRAVITAESARRGSEMEAMTQQAFENWGFSPTPPAPKRHEPGECLHCDSDDNLYSFVDDDNVFEYDM